MVVRIFPGAALLPASLLLALALPASAAWAAPPVPAVIAPPVAWAALPAIDSPGLRVVGSPFHPDGDGHRERVRIRVALAEPASLDLRIRDFDGRLVLSLATDEARGQGVHEWSWNGRDDQGRRVPDGPYRVVARIDTAGESVTLRRWLTKARLVPYPVAPEAVLVALDAGHGGSSPGAVSGGLHESDVNLDVALRLEAMLKGAGIGVMQTRRRDVDVSRPGVDLNGDGRYDRGDELVARNDVANQARADVHLAIHHNATGCHCVRGTEMYTHDRRTWSPEGLVLARVILAAHIKRLKAFAGDGWQPIDRGVRIYPFMALRPYRDPVMPRPSLQPSMLGESLFIDHPAERRLLERKRVRNAIATAYYDGIARFLARRRHGLRYELTHAPDQVSVGATASLGLRLTNRGNSTSSGWRLVARVVPEVFRYDGRPRRGPIVAEMALPDGLGPGASLEVSFEGIPMPSTPGRWLLKIDVDLPGGSSLGVHGVVGPQLLVETVP